MKKLGFLFFLLLSLPSTKILADDINKPLNVDACREAYQDIEKRLMEVQTCQNDQECIYFDYGYPWQEDECTKAVVSKSNIEYNKESFKQIEKYLKTCVFENEAESKKYHELKTKIDGINSEITSPASNPCNLSRVMCFKGYCRTAGWVANYTEKE